MKTPLTKFTLSLGFAMVVTLGAPIATVGQGSLTPPGPPGPTMKTLQQVEPRMPIASLPFTIATPGSYYLTMNASVATTAILVQSSNVTIDLNGFTVTGDGGQTDYGVLIDPSFRVGNITVRDGKFQNLAGAVVVGGEGANNVLVENIQMHNSTRTGIWIASDCDGAVIRNNLLVNCESGLSVTAFAGDFISGVTVANNRVLGGSAGVRLHGQDGSVRDISILNNQLSMSNGTPISVSTFGTGSVARLLVDLNHCTKPNGTLGIIVPTNAAATIIRNVLTGCTMSVATAGNTIGPVITTIGTLGTNGAAVNPWANFQN